VLFHRPTLCMVKRAIFISVRGDLQTSVPGFAAKVGVALGSGQYRER